LVFHKATDKNKLVAPFMAHGADRAKYVKVGVRQSAGRLWRG